VCVCFGISIFHQRSFLRSDRLYVHILLECVGVIFLIGGILVYMSIKDFRILSLLQREEVEIL